MTIASDTRQTDAYAGPQDAGYAFDFFFRLHDTSMLEVMLSVDGATATVVDSGNYTVALNTDQYNDPGGTVTYTPALASNETLRIRSNLTLQQQTDLTASNIYNPRSVEDSLDYLLMCIQDVARKAGV